MTYTFETTEADGLMTVRLGGERPSVTSDDLVDALEAILQGRDPARPETTVDGCVITLPSAVESSNRRNAPPRACRRR